MESSSVLNPGNSPRRAGVRRLNHKPLYIIGVIVLVVAFLIIWVANDKNKPLFPSSTDHGGRTDDYAKQIVGERAGYLPAAHTPTPVALPSPPASFLPSMHSGQ